ncbi:hypothetical protein CEXT_206751 [Caerostris extrusa]|uniref:Uncharacterized protein n=1 Tax=Caerostris extrusa TaxID=172846 RepID=A0AAV4REM9_CAEEX|nr:hypothetical protein CEXT_206751 [Caerostris extrusa]
MLKRIKPTTSSAKVRDTEEITWQLKVSRWCRGCLKNRQPSTIRVYGKGHRRSVAFGTRTLHFRLPSSVPQMKASGIVPGMFHPVASLPSPRIPVKTPSTPL